MLDERQLLRDYAERISIELHPETSFDLPLTVDLLFGARPFTRASYLEGNDLLLMDGRPVRAFLKSYPCNALLLGNPGAGKSHSLKLYSATCAGQLQWQIEANSTVSIVPIYVDLKRYDGNFGTLVVQALSPSSLDSVVKLGQVHFLVDSFNEAPRRYLESGILAADLQSWLTRYPNCRWTISSRTAEGLQFFDAEQFMLEVINRKFVEDRLLERQIDLGDRFGQDLLSLFQRPFFFSALLKNRLRIQPGGMHPSQAIETMISSFEFEIWSEFQIHPDLLTSMGPLAAAAIDSGEEIMAQENVVTAIREGLKGRHQNQTADRIVERLLERGLFLAHGHQRIAFYHQSITELIAARHIAEGLKHSPIVVDRLLNSTRWDQSLHLVTYYLDEAQTTTFMKRLMDRDIGLAIRCVHFAEYGRSILVARILEYLLKIPTSDWIWDYPLLAKLKSMEVDATHAEKLRELLRFPHSAGGTAAGLLHRAIGDDALEPILDEVFSRPTEYGLGQDAGNSLATHCTQQLMTEIFARLKSCQFPPGSKISESGVVQFFKGVTANVEPESLIDEFFSKHSDSMLAVSAMCNWARANDSPVAIAFLVKMLARGHGEAIFPLHLRATWRQSEIIKFLHKDFSACSKTLELYLTDPEIGRWDVLLIEGILERSVLISDWLQKLIGRSTGTIRVALLSVVPERKDELWEQLELLLSDPERKFAEWEYALLEVAAKQVKWSDHVSTLMDAIDRRDSELTGALTKELDLTDIPPVSWQWVKDQLPWFQQAAEEGLFVTGYFATFAVFSLTDDGVQQMLAEFHRPESPYREILAGFFLYLVVTKVPQDFTDESVKFLIDQMYRQQLRFSMSMKLLAAILTEEMVERYLLPRLNETDEQFSKNLRTVLRMVGERHRRRYIS